MATLTTQNVRTGGAIKAAALLCMVATTAALGSNPRT
jgi:hypothetical protein